MYCGFFIFPGLSGCGGTMLNLTITSIVALSVSLTNSRHKVNDLRQHRELRRMNEQLRELVRKDPLTELLIREISNIRWQNRLVGACCSVGVCWSGRPGLTHDQIYREADQALYEAKSQGKGRCLVRELSEQKA